ncbi:MAG: hypothetical protein WBG90_21775 [Saonia sp.]
MKKTIILIILSILLFSNCKTEKKAETPEPKIELTILEEVAYAHGFENWKTVKEIQFTFNVDRDTSHFERKWIWKPKTNEVTGISLGDTVTYNRNRVDSTLTKVDAAFINDKYWLLAPFNLVWDKNNVEYEHNTEVETPISKQSMQKLTIVYGNAGGYTPGDAYDFYFGDDYQVKEWVFRKENQKKPSMTTTWEDYIDRNGLKISSMHKNAEGNFKLYLSDIEVQVN